MIVWLSFLAVSDPDTTQFSSEPADAGVAATDIAPTATNSMASGAIRPAFQDIELLLNLIGLMMLNRLGSTRYRGTLNRNAGIGPTVLTRRVIFWYLCPEGERCRSHQ